MNIVNRLTLRCLRLNKRRTLVTIIGIILSVAMLTAISTIFFSFMDLMQRDTIAKSGEWHASLNGVEPEKLAQAEQAENVKAVLLTRNIGFTKFIESKNPDKPFFYIEEYNTPAFTHLNQTLASGGCRSERERPQSPRMHSTLGQSCKSAIPLRFSLAIGLAIQGGSGSEKRLSTGDYPVRNTDGSLAERFEPRGERTYTITGILKGASGKYDNEMASAFPIIGYCDAASLAAEGELADPRSGI